MGNASIMARALQSALNKNGPVSLIELGAGDGDFLLSVARRLGPSWQGTQAILLDRHNLLTTETAHDFGKLGWDVQTVTGDVLDWYHNLYTQSPSVVVANLFLHHFDSKALAELLGIISQRSRLFVAVEPRRSLLALTVCHLSGLIGCNAVTRHDAPLSVRAGFSGQDLSQLWDAAGQWLLEEQPAGLFSHLFVARKQAA